MSCSSLASNVTAFDGSCSTEELPYHNLQPGSPFGLDNACINANGVLYSQSELNPSPETQVVANSAQGMCPRNSLNFFNLKIASNFQQLLISNQLSSNHPNSLPPNPPLSSSLLSPPSKNVPLSGIQKRKINTLAARKYRQKRVDHINYLEAALKESQIARDALKIRAARLEGEVEVLRRLVGG